MTRSIYTYIDIRNKLNHRHLCTAKDIQFCHPMVSAITFAHRFSVIPWPIWHQSCQILGRRPYCAFGILWVLRRIWCASKQGMTSEDFRSLKDSCILRSPLTSSHLHDSGDNLHDSKVKESSGETHPLARIRFILWNPPHLILKTCEQCSKPWLTINSGIIHIDQYIHIYIYYWFSYSY